MNTPYLDSKETEAPFHHNSPEMLDLRLHVLKTALCKERIAVHYMYISILQLLFVYAYCISNVWLLLQGQRTVLY